MEGATKLPEHINFTPNSNFTLAVAHFNHALAYLDFNNTGQIPANLWSAVRKNRLKTTHGHTTTNGWSFVRYEVCSGSWYSCRRVFRMASAASEHLAVDLDAGSSNVMYGL